MGPSSRDVNALGRSNKRNGMTLPPYLDGPDRSPSNGDLHRMDYQTARCIIALHHYDNPSHHYAQRLFANMTPMRGVRKAPFEPEKRRTIAAQDSPGNALAPVARTQRLLHQKQLLLGSPRRQFGPGFPEKYVDLAPHPEPAGKIDPGLHRKADSRDQRSGIGRFEVVEVGPRPVQIPVDGMAGAVDEIRPVPRLAYHAAGDIVQLRPRHISPPSPSGP